ncbi:MAG TPA: PIG-L deacetylase family protein [Solirubrobacteraceae bacterium]|nr:PIG-L deacetylase family protein [Solirubrobacteraceae bacterium]
MSGGGVLVVTAHPDDEVLIAGGLLAACAESGIPTGVVCLTRGEHGPIADPGLATPQTLPEVRTQELLAACAELGVGFVKCYRREDGNLRWSDRSAIAAQLARMIDVRRPEVVVTFGEDGLYYHPDHITAYHLCRRAIERSGCQPALYRSVWLKPEMCELAAELRRRHLSDDLWGLEPEDFGVDEEPAEGVVLDLRRFTAQKLRALHCHSTQLANGHALAALPDDLAERFFGYERFATTEPRSGGADLFDRLARAVPG